MIISDGSPLVFDSDIFSDDMMEGTAIQSDSIAFLGVSTEKAEKGAKIISLSKESPAEKVGLLENDIITKLNNEKVEDPESLFKAVTANKPGDEVKITYLRNGKEKTTKVTLQLKKQIERKVIVTNNGRRPRRPNPPGFPPPQMRNYGSDENIDMAHPNFPAEGFPLQFNPFPPKQKLGVKIQDTEDGNGVKIIEVADNSVAAMAGIQKDDVVTEVSGQKINNTDDIRELLRDNEDLSTIKVKVLRNGKEMNFDIKPPRKLKTMVL
jgi:serine protease Do